jgi:hypothetical protein
MDSLRMLFVRSLWLPRRFLHKSQRQLREHGHYARADETRLGLRQAAVILRKAQLNDCVRARLSTDSRAAASGEVDIVGRFLRVEGSGDFRPGKDQRGEATWRVNPRCKRSNIGRTEFC